MSNGEPVTELSTKIWVVFQARNGDYWFGSDGRASSATTASPSSDSRRNTGSAEITFRSIQGGQGGQHLHRHPDRHHQIRRQGPRGLVPVESKDWRLDPDDLWFKGDSMVDGPYRYDGKTLHHLEFPKSALEDEHRRRNPKPPASPYGVYTIHQDSKGYLWFGTVAFGLCHYDGKSFGWMYERELTETPGGGSFGIRSIMEDKHGKFWINNTGQRFVISPEPGEVQYKKEAGVDQPRVPGGKIRPGTTASPGAMTGASGCRLSAGAYGDTTERN